MSFTKDTIFKLLPLFNQVRDQETGNSIVTGQEFDGPLNALLGLIAEQVNVLEENFDQLYDDLFIETCAEWVVPYIGGLVGTRGLTAFPGASFSERAQVANTISYRRRKGTAAIVEQLARDVTGWTANVVEYFQLLATTQYLNHLRPGNLAISSLKNWEEMEYVNTPFDKLARTLDVRNIESKRGKYNIPNIGIFLWRINNYSITNAPAFKVDDLRYKFDALGKDTPLYNHPLPEDEITHLAAPINVPMPITRMVMYNYKDDYYSIDKSVFVNEQASVNICNLSDINDGTGNWINMPADKVSIDPVLGRIAFPASQSPSKVTVNYYYGFSNAIGGGEYARSETFMSEMQIIQVPQQQTSVQAALNQLESTGGIIEITDNAYYIETPLIKIAEGKKIEIRAQDKQRPVLILSDDMEVFGGENAVLSLNGIVISGGCIRVPGTDINNNLNHLDSLFITHCTLQPGASAAIGSVAAQPEQPRLIVEQANVTVNIESSVTGSIRASENAIIKISNSIIDAQDDKAIAYCGLDGLGSFGAVLEIKNTTVIGKVAARIMQMASNTIFYAAPLQSQGDILPVAAQRLQEGCVRFSYVPSGSRVPKRYNCQPVNDDEAATITPVFNSLKYGDAAYCQLSPLCATGISEGADNEAEMGAFCNLYQPQRIMNLRTRLNEYLRFGLQAGIFYAS